MTNFTKISLLATVFFVGHTPFAVIDKAQAAAPATEPMVENGTCTPTDESGAPLLNKDGTPMMGKYQRKTQNTPPTTDGLSMAAPEAKLAPEPLLFLDPKYDDSLNKILTFSTLHSIETEDLKSFKVEGSITNISDIPQTLILKIRQFETEQSPTPFSESSFTIDKLTPGETRPFTTKDQPLSPKRGHIVIKAEFQK